MIHEVQLREAARAIYDACFTLAPIDFDEAERRRTLHHARATVAAAQARAHLVPAGSAEGMSKTWPIDVPPLTTPC